MIPLIQPFPSNPPPFADPLTVSNLGESVGGGGPSQVHSALQRQGALWLSCMELYEWTRDQVAGKLEETGGEERRGGDKE